MTPPCSSDATADTFTKRFPRPIPLTSPLAQAEKQRDRNDSSDEEDKTEWDADFFAELLTARRSGGGRGRVGIGTGGREEGENGAAEDIGQAVSLVHDESEGEVGR